MVFKSNSSAVCIFVVTMLFSSVTQADLINWTYTGELSLGSGETDVLGIDGEIFSITVIFDEAGVWQANGLNLVFSATSAFGSVTGGHSVTVNTVNPAAVYLSSLNAIYISESISNGSNVDLIIDGDSTITFGAESALVVGPVPTLGGKLFANQLPTNLEIFSLIGDSTLIGLYILVNE